MLQTRVLIIIFLSVYSNFSAQREVIDFDGNLYKTVIIGEKEWMAENLKVTHYPDGSPIPRIVENKLWAELKDVNTDDAFCYAYNDSLNDLGCLYTYSAAIADHWTKDHFVNQGVCPDGWRLPTDADWAELERYLDSEGFSASKGSVLKSKSSWIRDGNGTDNYNFSAKGSGVRNGESGQFYFKGTHSYWWSASECDSVTAFDRSLRNYRVKMYRSNFYKSYGFSVRCISDSIPKVSDIH